ncbi:unnamed protein product [Polarella glacialis]|uniref:WW domain-containing protein n=1 Tax=Polarella glacialis TaxID=89957 RepID=A0A813DUZ2_POLGL|nr:unnamed protein product [Polarella glacialis]
MASLSSGSSLRRMAAGFTMVRSSRCAACSAFPAPSAPAPRWRRLEANATQFSRAAVRSVSSKKGYDDSEDPDPDFFARRGPARTREGATLPDGWLQNKSSARGVYYSHQATGVTQWDLPSGPPTPQQVNEAFQEKYGRSVAPLHPGAEVRLVGLQSQPHLESQLGIVEQWDQASGMVRIRLLAIGDLKLVKPQNLLVTAAATGFQTKRPEGEENQDAGQEIDGGTGWRTFLVVLSGGAFAYWILKFSWLHVDDSVRAAAASRAAAAAALQDSTDADASAAGSSGGAAASTGRSGAAVRRKASGAATATGPASANAEPAEAAALVVADGASPPPLPVGWSENTDPASGRSYFWKQADPSRTTTWKRPE